MIAWLKSVLNRLGELLAQGAITRAGGDTDEFDVIDHKTGKRK